MVPYRKKRVSEYTCTNCIEKTDFYHINIDRRLNVVYNYRKEVSYLQVELHVTKSGVALKISFCIFQMNHGAAGQRQALFTPLFQYFRICFFS